MNAIRDWLWIGASSDAENLALLQDNEITAVFSPTIGSSWLESVRGSVRFLVVDQDANHTIPPEKLDKFVEFVRLERGHRLLIHAGSSEALAVAFAALALVAVEGLAWEQALGAVEAVRNAVPSLHVVDSIVEYLADQNPRA